MNPLLKHALHKYFAARAFSFAASQSIQLTGTQTGRIRSADYIRGHKAEVRLYDDVLQSSLRRAFPTLYREGRRWAYGLVYSGIAPTYKEQHQ